MVAMLRFRVGMMTTLFASAAVGLMYVTYPWTAS
jgi:hypothetical protein